MTLAVQVIEMFKAFTLPLQPYARDPPEGPLEINYDSILPSSRKYVAKSVSTCRKALKDVRNELEAWGKRSKAGTGALAKEMSRPVILVAVTPTRQEMASSVGREVSLMRRRLVELTLQAVVLLVTCDTPLLNVKSDRRARAGQ